MFEITSSPESRPAPRDQMYDAIIPSALFRVYVPDAETSPEDAKPADLGDLVDALNDRTANYIHRTASLDYMFYESKKGEIVRHLLDKEEAVTGQFHGFTFDATPGQENIVAQMLVNVTPYSSPGIMREEEVRLWKPEAQALCWLNFGPNPRRRLNLWRRVALTR